VRGYDAWLQAPLERQAREEMAYEAWEEAVLDGKTDLDFDDWLQEQLEGDR
jgi:hypothetical protein